MRKHILGAMICLSAAIGLWGPIAVLAQAAPLTTFNISWIIPTTREPVAGATVGVPLAVSEIASYNLYYAVDSGAETKVNIVPGTLTAKVLPIMLSARATPYSVNFAITAVDNAGLESKRSPTKNVIVPVSNANPGAPTIVNVTFSCLGANCSAVAQ